MFREYQDADMRFAKTAIPVWLAQYGGDQLISRSQGKRLMTGMEKFEVVVLDFSNVDFIGQGFADQVFRVFVNERPQITVTPINTNEAVERMIKHVLG